MAVLVSGSVESLLLTPLLSNVVRANAKAGLHVDIFFNLKAPAKGKHEEAMDPKISQLLQGSNGELEDSVCRLARAQGASHCAWELEGEEPTRARESWRHQPYSILTHQPYSTPAGKEVVARWRSLSRLLATARTQEAVDEYDAIVVARADDYWMAPLVVNVEDFQMDALQVSAVPCLDDTGINDKAVVMGREAADVILSMYDAWQVGDARLNGTRTAEEAWFRIASQSGLNIKPELMPMALASYTQSGLPCFKESTFNLSRQQRYQDCFAESVGDAPLTSLFTTFGCEAMNPYFYDLLWPQQVHKLHELVARTANQDQRNAIILTVVDPDEVESAVSMLTSLQGVGEEALSLVVGTSTGVCKLLADSPGVAGHKCVVVHPSLEVQLSVFKHAILTTVALAGLSDRVMYVSPRVVLEKPLTQFAASDKHILFARDTTSARDGKACSEDPNDPTQLDSSVLLLSDAPEVANVLLRAWEHMAPLGGVEPISQRAALAAALGASSRSEVGFLPCGLQLPQAQGLSPEDRLLSAAQPPGISEEQIQRDIKKALDAAWLDRMRREGEGSRHRKAAAGAAAAESQRQGAWQRNTAEWKDMWQRRVEELRQENGYNETEAKEERRRRREYRRTHEKTAPKRVRYLPPEEAERVRAREEKWRAEVERQRSDDLAKADERRKAFQRQVEQAQKIIAGVASNPTDQETEDAVAEAQRTMATVDPKP